MEAINLMSLNVAESKMGGVNEKSVSASCLKPGDFVIAMPSDLATANDLLSVKEQWLIDDTTHIIGYRELEQDEELTRDNASDCTICAKLIGIINAWKEMDNDAMMKKKEYNRKYNFLFDYEGGVTNASRLLVEKDVRVERVSAPV